MKNQKLISRNVIKKFAKGGYGGGTFSGTGTSRKWNSNSNDTKRIEFEKDKALVMSGLIDPQEYKAKWFPNTEVLTIPGTNRTIVNGTGMSGADPLLSWFVGGSFSKSLPFLNKLAGKAVKNAMTKTAKARVYKYSDVLPVPVSTLPIRYTPKPVSNLTSKLLGTAALITAAGMGYNEGNNNSKLKLENYLSQEATDLIRKLLESNNISNLQLALSNNTNWSKAKNSNTKLSPWSNNLNNQLTQKSNTLNNNNLSNIRTSGNIWSLRSSDGSVKNFRDSVIDYQNSHSEPDYNFNFTLPTGNVPVLNEAIDLLVYNSVPQGLLKLPSSIFTRSLNLTNTSSSRRNLGLLSTSTSYEYRLPESLAEYRSKNQVLSSNSSDITITPEQKEEIQTTLTNPISELNIDNLREEIKIYFRNGNPIETVKSESDIDKWDDDTVMRVFKQIEHIYNDPELSQKISYTPPKETKEGSSTSPFARTTPSSVDLNRADVRAIMSHYGLDTTPSLRKAFRKYLAGDRSLDISFIDLNSNLHKDWVAPFVVYKKKGGRLVSRNLVERFQKGKAIKGALKVIYNTLATPIHAIFGNPGKRGGYSGGSFGGAGSGARWSNPTYSYNEIYPADTLLVPVTQTFNDAFADARRRGLDTFEFNGGIYGTELGDNPNWKVAGDTRTRDAVIPVPIPADTIRRTSDVPRNDTIITDVAYRRYPISTSNINKIFNK